MRYFLIVVAILITGCKRDLPPVEDGKCKTVIFRAQGDDQVECILNGKIWRCVLNNSCELRGDAPLEASK